MTTACSPATPAATRFSGRVLLVTGGAGGLAAATARRYAGEGGRVVVTDVEAERAEAVAAELPGSIGIGCDVADEDAVRGAVAMARNRMGRIDAVLNAAGYAEHCPIEDFSLARWNRMLAVHVTGTFLVCREALPLLREAGGGSIVNLASVAALVARPHLAAYSAAKGAIVSFSRQLALDVGADGIRVNVLAPGTVRTPMTQRLIEADDDAEGRMAEVTMLGRIGEADEVSAAACFLLSGESSFFTGSVLVPDGGMTSR
ncbi:SDR family NAD(P)-dependent oxidoreductase [Dactylosporangium sp. CA-139066]|uniref:SDR family NAD(P)-dependent oxidoreductase n=1 Tax=Dactylosporangium sp. CA-139066 TaxID=3239930 RepID=UPI003D8FFE7E